MFPIEDDNEKTLSLYNCAQKVATTKAAANIAKLKA